jgi:pimeloyl-ACP methyl ester carboxylesterase
MILHAIQSGEGPPVVLLHGLFGAARNFGAVQRALTPRFKVIALDIRNHGDSPHAPDMRYPTLAADVQETLRSLGVERSALVGHSMGGKAAMALALRSPDVVARLLVSDIAPVAYQHDNTAIAAALEAIPLTPGLTRQAADAALAPAVKPPDIRAFLLQNLRFGTTPPRPAVSPCPPVSSPAKAGDPPLRRGRHAGMTQRNPPATPALRCSLQGRIRTTCEPNIGRLSDGSFPRPASCR